MSATSDILSILSWPVLLPCVRHMASVVLNPAKQCSCLIVQCAGKMFWELAPYFPDGIVFGIVNPYSKRVLVNPPRELRLSLGDELLILRPTTYKSGKYAVQKTPAKMDLGKFALLRLVAIT